MSIVNTDLLRERFNHSRIDRFLLSDKSSYVEHARRGIDLDHRCFHSSARAFIEDQPSRYPAVLRSVPGRLVSIHFGEGCTIMGVVEPVEPVDTTGGVLLSIFCTDGDGYDGGGFPFGGPCVRHQYIPSDIISEAWLIEVRTERAGVGYVREKTVAERDPRRLQYLTDVQQEAFSDLQLLEPACRLHGSTVYGMSEPDSDVDVCVAQLNDLAGSVDAGLTPFHIIEDLLHLNNPRLRLRHKNGTEMDVVGIRNYEEEKDRALCCVCQNVVFKNFFVSLQRWWKDCRRMYDLEPKYGYPNKFNLFLVAIFFLQLFEGVPVWSRLAARDSPRLQCRNTADDIFGSFLEFLLNHSCRPNMNLRFGNWDEKRENQSLRRWLLKDPCNNNNVFSHFSPEMVAKVEICVREKLDSCPPYNCIYETDN